MSKIPAILYFAIIVIISSSLFADIGHGIQKKGSLSHEEITLLKNKYAKNPVLSKAFAIIEGADRAVAHDVATLLATIKKNPKPTDEDLNKLYSIMEKDKQIISEAVNCFDSGTDKEKVYRPFVDLLHTLGSQGKIKGYSGRKGIENAISLLKKYRHKLINGEIPQQLEDAPSRVAIDLRIALFYLERFSSLEKKSLTTYKSFCPTSYFGKAQHLENALKETSFYENGKFYAPSNGYVKNADVCFDINLDQLGEKEPIGPRLQMVFTDCSGFMQHVARLFHPHNEFLGKKRQMSYELAAFYDAAANEKMGTKDKMYDIAGIARELSPHEKEQLKKYSVTIKNLKDVYEAVVNPLDNIQAGDIIIERGLGEGHVMIAVEQQPDDKSQMAVVELTSFGGSGYNWTREKLQSAYHRVLRIKNTAQ